LPFFGRDQMGKRLIFRDYRLKVILFG